MSNTPHNALLRYHGNAFNIYIFDYDTHKHNNMLYSDMCYVTNTNTVFCDVRTESFM